MNFNNTNLASEITLNAPSRLGKDALVLISFFLQKQESNTILKKKLDSAVNPLSRQSEKVVETYESFCDYVFL